MITLEYLVIGIANNFEVFVNKPFVNGSGNGIKDNAGIKVIKDGLQPFQLLWIFSKKVNFKSFPFPAFEILDEQVKLAIESWLFLCLKFNFEIGKVWLVSKFYHMSFQQSSFQLA